MDIVNLIITYSLLLGVDPNVALSVAKVESNFNPNVIGRHGEIGLFQILPEYSGYSRKGLFNPRINVMAGINRIKEVQEQCRFKDDLQYLICYNMGYERAKKVKHPSRNKYFLKVKYEHQKL